MNALKPIHWAAGHLRRLESQARSPVAESPHPPSGFPAPRIGRARYLHALEKLALQYSASMRGLQVKCERLGQAWCTSCDRRREERRCSTVFSSWAYGLRGKRQGFLRNRSIQCGPTPGHPLRWAPLGLRTSPNLSVGRSAPNGKVPPVWPGRLCKRKNNLVHSRI